MDVSDKTPFTERSNAITQAIDVATSTEMFAILGKTDAEIFSGVTSRNLFDCKVVNAIAKLSDAVRKTLHSYPQDAAIVLGGCGTSGRLGYLISKVCNELTEKIGLGTPFHYTIAGGDKSLLTSQEAPEDDPKEGVSSLVKICADKKRVIYVGITCGISAPFVGGQLDWCMKELDKFTPVLLGFNDIDMARQVEIPGWNKTMFDIAQEMDSLSESGKGILINPILGAEAITGSSRMKGGSATKIILETAFLSAINGLETNNSLAISPEAIASTLHSYQDICSEFYSTRETSEVATKLIQRGGNALKNGAPIHYIASGWMGVIPLIDSTECPPTFGSTVDDVRGFVRGGYDFLDIDDYGQQNPSFRLSIDDATKLYSRESLQNTVACVFLRGESDLLLKDLNAELGAALKTLRTKNEAVVVLLTDASQKSIGDDTSKARFDEVLEVQFPSIKSTAFEGWGARSAYALRESLYGMCLKWLVNAVSTCSHVLLGKVYRNYMCDVKVSNNKLYHRAITIIQFNCVLLTPRSTSESRGLRPANDFAMLDSFSLRNSNRRPHFTLAHVQQKMTGVGHEHAEKALLKSIYETDAVTENLKSSPVSRHYAIGASKDRVVPLAIILAKRDCSVEEAKATLQKYSIVKNAVLAMDDRRNT